VLVAVCRERAEASSRSFVRFGALLGRLDLRRAAHALLRPFDPGAYRTDRGTAN
jgi:hypothetical protein